MKYLPLIILSSEDMCTNLVIHDTFNGLLGVLDGFADYDYSAASSKLYPRTGDASLFEF